MITAKTHTKIPKARAIKAADGRCDFCGHNRLTVELFQKAYGGHDNNFLTICQRCCENVLAMFTPVLEVNK